MKLFSSKGKANKNSRKKSPQSEEFAEGEQEHTHIVEEEQHAYITEEEQYDYNAEDNAVTLQQIRSKKKKRPVNHKEWKFRERRKKQIIYGSLIITGAFLVTIALRIIFGGFAEDSAARGEYERLREQFSNISGQSGDENSDESTGSYINGENNENSDTDIRSLSLDELAAMNRDFIGWISAGYAIDYPVVRGSDNNKYVNTTFFGTTNTAGTIFMDYRNKEGFDEQVAILYGHHTRDGSMFSTLINYLDQSYLRNNPNIKITTRDGRILNYKIFAAKLTDAWDIAYSTGINDSANAGNIFPDAPANTSRFLLLSTCTRNRNDDERVLVFAALA